MKIGILTSGGDCAGLNAVMRGIGLYVYRNIKNAEIVGFRNGYVGLIKGECIPLRKEDFEGLLDVGGTMLGTNRTPFKQMTVPEEDGTTRLEKMCANYKKLGLDCLFTLGGAGTHRTAALLCAEGCNVIGLPKTIASACPRPSTTTSTAQTSPSASTRRSTSPQRRSSGCAPRRTATAAPSSSR